MFEPKVRKWQVLYTQILAGVFAWGIGCGSVDVPDVFASIQDSLCFIDFAVKCKHGRDFITHFDYSRECSTWYEDQIEELKTVPQIATIKRFKRRLEAIKKTCKLVKRKGQPRKFD